MPADPALTLAEHICQTTFAALPASTVCATKRDILDTTTDPQTYRDQFGADTAKRRPRHVVEAQFSTPFLVAAALVLGKVGIGEVAAVDDSRILALAARLQG